MANEKVQEQNAVTEIDGKLAQQPDMSLSRVEDVGQEIERRFEVQKRIMSIMVKHIDPTVDIVMVEDQPSKTSSFANKLYRIIGGVFEYIKDGEGNPVVVRKNYVDEKKKPYYIYEAFGRYRAPYGDGGWFEASGSFSSRHKFFGKVDGAFKPLSAVDEQSVRTAALTECFKKCIFGGLGMGKLTKEHLKEWDVDISKVKGYSFKTGAKGGNTDDEKQGDTRAEIEKICRDLAKEHWGPADGVPCQTGEQVLKAITEGDYTQAGKKKHFDGYDSFSKITQRSLTKTLEKVKIAAEAWAVIKGDG